MDDVTQAEAPDGKPATSPPGRPGAVGIKDVARHAGVSVTTVSNVLNSTNRISSATRQRVLASIDELGYVRNAAARQLRAGSSGVMGLIVPDASNPFYAAIARGAEDAALERGGSVIVGSSHGDVERESLYVNLFEQQRVRGVLVAPVADAAARVQSLAQRGLTTVVVGRAPRPAPCSSVSIDNVSGGYLAAQHLMDTGRRRIAFVGPPAVPGVGDRLAGTRMAMTEAGAGDPEVLEPHGLTVSAGRELGAALIERGLDRLPDGIFCANDLLAIGMLHAFVAGGRLHIPDDVALIGYDDVDFAASAIVPLSSIRQPAELIGRTAVELLEREVADASTQHRHVLFPPELVVRQSTAG
jgi:LacI family transcriptional regulator